MNKKLIAIFAIAIFAVSTMAVLADTWVDVPAPFTFTADPSGAYSGVSISLCSDCACTAPLNPVLAHDFGLVMQANVYEWTFYVLNNGSEQVYLTYSPTAYTANGGQTSVNIVVTAIAYGDACETSGTTLAPPLASNALPYNLPEKTTSTPSNGFLLLPDKVVKLDVKLTVLSIDEGMTFTVPFSINGVNVLVQA